MKTILLLCSAFSIAGCTSTNTPKRAPQSAAAARHAAPLAAGALPDKAAFLQTDRRWAKQTLGGSYESLKSDGCLVTAAAMALVNLGFVTDPGDLVNRLKASNGFTKQGWMIWSGLERATGGVAKTVFYNRKDDAIVRSCLAAGYYPLVKFDLASRRTHWAVVVKDTPNGFYIRDPMVESKTPIPLSSRAKGIAAVRCIGVPARS